MNNVVEGKSINNVFSKIVGLGKALLISPTTLSAIDGKPLVMRYKEENEQMEQKEQFIPTPETRLVDERYATNPIVKASEQVFGVTNSTEPLPQSNQVPNVSVESPSEEVPVISEIKPISIVTPEIEETEVKNETPSIPKIEIPSIQEASPMPQFGYSNETDEIPKIKPLVNSELETPSIPSIEIPVLRGGDEVVDAINTQMLTPEEPKPEVAPQPLQTPQEAFKNENGENENKAYIDVLDKIEQVRRMHLDALEGIKIETNRRFEEYY